VSRFSLEFGRSQAPKGDPMLSSINDVARDVLAATDDLQLIASPRVGKRVQSIVTSGTPGFPTTPVQPGCRSAGGGRDEGSILVAL
jgi:hypothetical protein